MNDDQYIIVRSAKDAQIGKLIELHTRCLENSDSASPNILKASQDLLDYMLHSFFSVSGSFYMAREHNGRYICSLRAEPYQDGFLISGLETHPEYRRRGYAKQLITELIDYLYKVNCNKIYSHIRKDNLPSIRLHSALGFHKSLDYAKMLDGSVLSNYATYIRTK